MSIKSHEQLNQAVCETFFILQLSKMGYYHNRKTLSTTFLRYFSESCLCIFQTRSENAKKLSGNTVEPG